MLQICEKNCFVAILYFFIILLHQCDDGCLSELCVFVSKSATTHHVRPESEHQRKGVPQGVQGAEDRGTPGLMHLPAAWDPADGELENKDTEAFRDVTI